MTKKALGIDIGGTKIVAAIVDETGEILSNLQKFNTPKTKAQIVQLLKQVISEHEKEIDIVAIATAGAVNNENNAVISSTGNLCADYNTIKFEELSEKKVFVENDANAAAWAEFKLGSAKGHNNSVILTLGTGVGGGIIIEGKLLKGKSGAAGEMHFKMRCDKHRKCTCGAYDCFEAYASGTGLYWTAKEIAGREITTYEVIDGVKRGDTLCREIFDKWQNDLICGCVGLANIFDPDSIILSGSMADFVEYEKVERAVNSQLVTMPVRILHAKMRNNAGLVGAALLAMSYF